MYETCITKDRTVYRIVHEDQPVSASVVLVVLKITRVL